MYKVLKIISIGFITLISIILIALFWPLPKIQVPVKSQNVLIKSVNVIDIKSGKILNNRNVWIEGNRIQSIDSLSVTHIDSGVLVIDGTNQYVIPGLWDMHTHSTRHSPWFHHPIYIANGVTTIRDMSGQLGRSDSYWAGTKDRMQWNHKLENYEQISPRYVLQSSYQINGANSVPDGFPDFFKVQTNEDVFSLLAYYQEERADFIKVYAEIPAEGYRTLAKNCAQYNLYLAGHKPLNISLHEAVLAGQRSFEHGRILMFDCFPFADSLRRAVDKGKTYRNFMPSMITEFDRAKAEELMNVMSHHNSHWVPTLQTLKVAAMADDEIFIQSPYINYIPTSRKILFWNPDLSRSVKDNTSAVRRSINKKFYQSVKMQVAMAQQYGVPIMAGTDVTDTYVFPGFSLHSEIHDLVDAGLTNLEALQAANLIPAQFSGREGDLGSIEVGKLADLVLLNSNPLTYIAHTRTITGVLLNGNYYEKNTLNQLKQLTKDLAGLFHMNVKFIYSLLASPLMRKQIAD
jgi:hypothetical protein